MEVRSAHPLPGLEAYRGEPVSFQHIYPTNDLEPHDTESAGNCKCEPTMEVLENGDILFIHNSYDGREIIERLEHPNG